MSRYGPWMSSLEVEVRLGIGREKVRRLVETGELSVERYKNRLRYSRSEVEAYARRREGGLSPTVAPEVVAMRRAVDAFTAAWNAGASNVCPLCDLDLEPGEVAEHLAAHRTALRHLGPPEGVTFQYRRRRD